MIDVVFCSLMAFLSLFNGLAGGETGWLMAAVGWSVGTLHAARVRWLKLSIEEMTGERY